MSVGRCGGICPSIGGAATIPCADGKITALGSTALQPVVDAAAKQYVAACAGSPIDVQGGGSGTGLTQVLQGGADIGNSDVPAESKLKPEEASALVDHVVARQGWLMIASKDVTGVTDLSAVTDHGCDPVQPGADQLRPVDRRGAVRAGAVRERDGLGLHGVGRCPRADGLQPAPDGTPGRAGHPGGPRR
jgi:hypothetical protein